jgi:hypothetical protein
MIDLDERLQRLADSVELPATSPQDDLDRGRARRRHRNLGAAGAALTTAAVIGTSVVLLSGGTGHPGAGPGFAGMSPRTDASARAESRDAAKEMTREETLKAVLRRTHGKTLDEVLKSQVLSGYRDILREDLDPAGTRIQTGPITNQQSGDHSLGTKLDWNGGGMLEIAVGRSLEGVQFFCDGGCTQQSVAGATKALVLSKPGSISVAVFQDDGDIVALTADTSFGNNGTSTTTLGLTVDQLLTAAADARLNLPDPSVQSSGAVGTQ